MASSHPGRDGRPLGVEPGSLDSHHLDYIRLLRTGKVAQPTPERAWAIGGPLSKISGKRWLNPVVMLFACGHYSDVAGLFVRLRPGVIAVAAQIELARTLPEVFDNSAGDEGEVRIEDDLAIREALKWEGRLAPEESQSRRIWSIEARAFAAFAESWRARSNTFEDKPGATALIDGCELVTDYAVYPIQYRDHHVAVLITDWLRGTRQ